MPLTQFPANIDVSMLAGSNGFMITGGQGQGYWLVSDCGDVNADGIADLVIGAPFASNDAGTSYVIFGKSGVGNGGALSVSSLTGTNGFTITGFPAMGFGGWSVSGAGDINNDGIDDLVIGAPATSSRSGAVYVIFGKIGIGGSGTLSVASLSGSNGFTIAGFPASSNGGNSVSNAGDINHDGITDLVIGAPYASSQAGVSYVIFGKSGIGGSGTLSVSSLSGINGFTITGFPAASIGGYSVNSAGDVNHDGIADLVIGAPYVLGAGPAGTSYVIFGKSGVGSSGILSVASLTGANGFTINGFSVVSNGGYSVSGCGDINNDGIADLVIGAPYASSQAGASYVIFGKSGIGSSGILSVSSLTGSNGFAISGFPAGSQGGCFVSGTRDLNHDGIADLVLGVPHALNNAGEIYVIFGNNEIGKSGMFSIASLRGTNGFAITGFLGAGGWSVSGVGDLNHDGIADLMIGANGAGAIIFGDGVTELLTNQLTIIKGHSIIFDHANLNATSINFPSNNPNIIFTISNAQHGHFEQMSNPGIAITQFIQQQVNQGQIQFVDDNSVVAPSYSVSVGDGGFAGLFPPQAANITYIHRGPLMITNTLAINQGQTIIVSTNFLNAINQDNLSDTPNLIFTISNVQHGQFESIFYPGVPITLFTQAQIQGNDVQFVQDGSINAPSYSVQVSDGVGGIITAPLAAVVSFNLPPVLVNNNFSINQGQALILSSANLSATDPDDSAPGLVFLASNIQHGHFELINNPGTVVTSFTQAEVQSSDVQFIPDGSINVPSFTITVSDGKETLLGVPATITFNLAPILVNNALKIKQGETVILTPADLSASDPDDTVSSLIFIVNNVQYGHFELNSASGIAITSFSQAQVQNGMVQFVQDGSPKVPSFSVSVSDGKVTTIAQTCLITFDAAPVLTSNQLTLSQAQTVTITPSDLSASDQETAASNLIFTAVDVTHGNFVDSDNLGTTVTQFSQQRIFDGTLKFVPDGSSHAPSYSMSVSDGILNTTPSPAIINFSPNESSNNTTRNAIVGVAVSGSIGLLFLAVKLGATYKADQYLKKVFEGDSESEKAMAEFYQKIIRPLAKKIFEHIKTTKFLGYRSESDTKAYITAFEHLVARLSGAGINIEEETASAVKQTQFFNEIARQTRQLLVPDYKRCSMTYLYSFFRAEVSPKQIEDKVDVIANAVAVAFRTSANDSIDHKSSANGVVDIELRETKLTVEEESNNLSEKAKLLAKQMGAVDKQFEAIDTSFKKMETDMRSLTELVQNSQNSREKMKSSH